MVNWTEERETPYERWQRIKSECTKIILYCDEYNAKDGRQLFPEPWTLPFIQEQYGDPSPELRQMAKDRMKEEYLKYWETI